MVLYSVHDFERRVVTINALRVSLFGLPDPTRDLKPQPLYLTHTGGEHVCPSPPDQRVLSL